MPCWCHARIAEVVIWKRVAMQHPCNPNASEMGRHYLQIVVPQLIKGPPRRQVAAGLFGDWRESGKTDPVVLYSHCSPRKRGPAGPPIPRQRVRPSAARGTAGLPDLSGGGGSC